MNPDSDAAEYMPEPPGEVGYGRPPKATRFKKGTSGNPQGRPKGSLNVVTVLTKALLEKVVIREHGQRKAVTKLEAAIKQLVNKAATGELRALRYLFELAGDVEAKQHTSGASGPVLNDLDQEVMEGILKRLQAQQVEDDAPMEVPDDADQPS